jgi:hypothetical protein
MSYFYDPSNIPPIGPNFAGPAIGPIGIPPLNPNQINRRELCNLCKDPIQVNLRLQEVFGIPFRCMCLCGCDNYVYGRDNLCIECYEICNPCKRIDCIREEIVPIPIPINPPVQRPPPMRRPPPIQRRPIIRPEKICCNEDPYCSEKPYSNNNPCLNEKSYSNNNSCLNEKSFYNENSHENLSEIPYRNGDSFEEQNSFDEQNSFGNELH